MSFERFSGLETVLLHPKSRGRVRVTAAGPTAEFPELWAT